MAESCKTLNFDFIVPISKTIVGVSRLSRSVSVSLGRSRYDRIHNRDLKPSPRRVESVADRGASTHA